MSACPVEGGMEERNRQRLERRHVRLGAGKPAAGVVLQLHEDGIVAVDAANVVLHRNAGIHEGAVAALDDETRARPPAAFVRYVVERDVALAPIGLRTAGTGERGAV